MPKRSSLRWSFCRVAVALAGGALLLLSGCGKPGPQVYPVVGRVVYQGEPLTTGTVMFTPQDGPAAAAIIGLDGSYRLEAVAGEHRVSVTAQQRLPEDFNPANLPDDWLPPPSLVPPKYNRPSTSGLVVQVQARPLNEADLVLEDGD